jgi:hypothetical protein
MMGCTQIKHWLANICSVFSSPVLNSLQYYPIISLVTMKPNFSMMHDLNPYVLCRGVNLMKVKNAVACKAFELNANYSG